MATIIDGGHWTCTEGAAELLVTRGLLYKCDKEHEGLLSIDYPIYHVSNRSPFWSWIIDHLQEAEQEYAEGTLSPYDVCTKCTHSRAEHRERTQMCAAIVGPAKDQCKCYRPTYIRGIT